jgi:putative Ca2+/H+ antiporter (TMEM165/GDT1 family)
MTSGATPSVWPRVDALRDTGLLLAGLVLVAALADGDLVKWLSGALFVIYALWGVSQDSSATQDVPLSWILIPLFIAIAIAIVVADGDWFYVVIVALATPLIVLTRVALAHRSRREPRYPGPNDHGSSA